MSYRELRHLTEYLRALGYPRHVSLESFRSPNFELVADCLQWMVHRYDPGIELSDDIYTEQDRINFLNNVANTMLTKARIKLNMKKIYSADGLAVKELLKVASLLYGETTLRQKPDDTSQAETQNMQIYLKEFDTKQLRQLANDITNSGALIYDSLTKEPEMRQARAVAAQQNLDSDQLERSLREQIEGVNNNVETVEGMLTTLDRDEMTVQQKIEKRQQELGRYEKRLATVANVRPAYMDEYEALQQQLGGLYTKYLEKFRNLEYLEHQLEQYNKEQAEELAESERKLKRLQKKMAEEQLKILRGDQDVDSGLDRQSMAVINEDGQRTTDPWDMDNIQSTDAKRHASGIQQVKQEHNPMAVTGSMMGPVDDDDSDENFGEGLTDSEGQLSLGRDGAANTLKLDNTAGSDFDEGDDIDFDSDIDNF